MKKRTIIITCGLLVISSIALFCLLKSHKEPVRVNTPKEVKASFKGQNNKTYEYLPKEPYEDTDIEVVKPKRTLNMKVNGVKHEVPIMTNEKQVFDKGKLVVKEEQEVTLDLKIPEQPKFKKGLYVTNDKKVGIRLSYQSKPFDIDITQDVYNKENDKKTEVRFTKWI